MENFELVTTKKLTIDSREFKNPALAEATNQIAKIYANAAAYAASKNQLIAEILGKVAIERSYVEDGFTSVADYAGKVFGIKRQNAYSLSAAGKLYNADDLNTAIRDFSPSKAAELAGVDKEVLNADIISGAIKPDMTQKQLRAYAETAKKREPDADEEAMRKEDETKAKEAIVLDTYTADMCLNYRPSDELVESCSIPHILDDWHPLFEGYVSSISGSDWPVERVKLPKGKATKDAKKTTVERYLYVNNRYSLVVEYRKYVAPVKKAEPEQRELTADEIIGKLSREQLLEALNKLDESGSEE